MPWMSSFANQFFQFSGSLLSSGQTPALSRYIGTLLGNLRFLNGVNKFRPIISGIFSDSPERVGNQCQNSTLIDTVLCRVVDKEFNGDTDAYVDYIFDNSLFTSQEKVDELIGAFSADKYAHYRPGHHR